MRRAVIVGNSGSGKTTLAGAVAARLDVPHVELDSLFHQADWTPTPPDRFRAAAAAALDSADASAAGWVVCGNYSEVRAGIWARADTIVWLDLPRHVVMGRVVRRTFTRVVTGAELWNGNRESAGNALALRDPERSIIRWTWDGVERTRSRYLPAMASDTWADLRWYHLRSPAEVRDWLAAVPRRRRTAPCSPADDG